MPEIASAAMVNRLPLAGGAQTSPIEFEGVEPTGASTGAQPQADLRVVTPDYFRTLQIPLLSGRVFTDSDTADAVEVGLIDERIANTFFKDVNPLGRRFRPAVQNQPWVTIVGVVGHIHHDRLDDDGRPQVYWNYMQRAQDRMALVVRTRTSPEAIAPSIAAAVRSIDPDQPIYDARTLEAVVDRSLAQRWLQKTILGSFAVIALVLASIGVYGVIAYTVGQRQRDFGIRLALGASRREIVAQVVRRGARLFAAGAVAGLIAAALTARLLATLLFRGCRFRPRQRRHRDLRPLPRRARRLRAPRAPGGRRRSVDRASRRITDR